MEVRRGMAVYLGALFGAALLAGCGSGGAAPAAPLPEAALTPPADLPGDWPVARPEELGIEASGLQALVGRLRRGELGRVHGLLIVRHGRLAVEEYFAGSNRDDVHTQQSVTKSVTSLLVGIAIDQGLIRSEDERVLGFFPEYGDLQAQDARRDSLAIEDLLTMRAGLLWTEEPYPGSDLERLNGSAGDWVRFVLDRPMREAPGTRWQYNSGGVIVLAGVLRSATGGDPGEFARRHLFEPLGIRGERWVRSPFDGLPHTGGGLFLRARDMARLGELVLRQGIAGGRQVVSTGWLERSSRRAAGPIEWPRPVYYGQLFWLFPFAGAAGAPAGPDIVTASGAGGQWIFTAPSLDLVVVFTADRLNPGFFTPVDLLYGDILPAVG
jgi:CubicO group peptidase (beta-lactamase class C family)